MKQPIIILNKGEYEKVVSIVKNNFEKNGEDLEGHDILALSYFLDDNLILSEPHALHCVEKGSPYIASYFVRAKTYEMFIEELGDEAFEKTCQLYEEAIILASKNIVQLTCPPNGGPIKSRGFRFYSCRKGTLV